MRILLVEDEKYMAEAIAQILKKNNYTVDIASDGAFGLDCALTAIYDAIILDVMLPKINGLEVLKKIRRENIFIPVIFLTAKGETEDKVIGLDYGADDYLPKPFEMAELLARIRALCRRKGEYLPEGILSCEDIELNLNTLYVFCGKKSFKLTLKECQLLEMLISHKGMLITKNDIIEKLWGFDNEVEYNNVEVYISFLRKKLVALQSINSIQTIRGAGYVLIAIKEETR